LLRVFLNTTKNLPGRAKYLASGVRATTIMKRSLRVCWAASSALALAWSANADLVHRYSFAESMDSTTAEDSVGSADGVLKGNGGYFDGSGQLILPGGGASGDDPSVIAGYLDLPNHIINVLPAVTFEAWVTWQATGSAWQRVFDFGTSAGGEDISDGYGNYLFMSPQGDANLRFAVRDPISGNEYTQITAEAPLNMSEEYCLTATYDPAANMARLFRNGVLIGTDTADVPLSSIDDVNNWLGRSQWGDAMFAGSYNEFRIYSTALTPLEAAASFASGPEVPSTDPSALGGVTAV